MVRFLRNTKVIDKNNEIDYTESIKIPYFGGFDMKKKLFTLALVLISTISLAACGGDKMGKAHSSDETTKNQANMEDALSKGGDTTHKKYSDEEIDENYKKAGIDKDEIIDKHGSVNIENESIGIEWDEEEEGTSSEIQELPEVIEPTETKEAGSISYYQMMTGNNVMGETFPQDAKIPFLSLDGENNTFTFVYDESGEKKGDYEIDYPNEDTKAPYVVTCMSDDGNTYSFTQAEGGSGLIFDAENSSSMPSGDDVYEVSDGRLFFQTDIP